MTRRGFLGRALGLLPLPAFIEASKLWLPPERSIVVAPSGSASALIEEYKPDLIPEVFGGLSLSFKAFYGQKLDEMLKDMSRFLEDPMACIPKNVRLLHVTETWRI